MLFFLEKIRDRHVLKSDDDFSVVLLDFMDFLKRCGLDMKIIIDG